MFSISGCFGPGYDGRLVILAAFICVIACATTVNLLSRAQLTVGRRKSLWLGGAALIFGSGVWSLHFVAMLAFMPGFPIAYEEIHTVRSITIAIIGAGIAFAVREALGRVSSGVWLAGILLGSAIAGMHYDGIAGMRLQGDFYLDSMRVGFSILIGVGFSILALARACDLSGLGRKIEVSCYFGLAVLGLHFSGMSALMFVPGPHEIPERSVLGSGSLALAVGSIAVAIIVGGMTGALTDQKLTKQSQGEADRLRQLTDASFEGIVIHSDGLIRNANETFARMTGLEVKHLIGRSYSQFIAEKDRSRIAAQISRQGTGRTHRVRVSGAGRHKLAGGDIVATDRLWRPFRLRLGGPRSVRAEAGGREDSLFRPP